MNVLVVSTWMQHRVLVPGKHGVHFPVLVRILKFLTLPFWIRVPLIISMFLCLFMLDTLEFCWKKTVQFRGNILLSPIQFYLYEAWVIH